MRGRKVERKARTQLQYSLFAQEQDDRDESQIEIYSNAIPGFGKHAQVRRLSELGENAK